MHESKELYATIMAGGKGRRLWPLSTSARPKQFIKFDGKSLLRRTFERIEPLIGADRTLVVTEKGKGEMVLEEVPQLSPENVIEEPTGKNTAPCIGLGGVFSKEKLGLDPENSVMVVLPADHLVQEEEEFRKLLQLAAKTARERDSLVTLGIEPTRPATGYGYIQASSPLEEGEGEDGPLPRRVESFKEKPDLERAEEFLRAGNYFWNSGMFIWKTKTILEAIAKHLPDLSSALKQIGTGLRTEKEEEILKEEYEKLDPISIDYGIMEKAENRALIPASVGWNDVGDWSSVEVLLEKDERGNGFWGRTELREVENSVAYNEEEKPLVCLGGEDLIIVNTEQALLVAPKDKAQDVKGAAIDFDSTSKEE